jgi:hypothetical protein
METTETNETDVAGVGPKLVAHSKSAEFSAARGRVVELFPFIYAASERMSARAISQFLEKEQGIKLSSVTINKALRDPDRYWNAFFDLIEHSARVFEREDKKRMKEFLFKKQIFWKPFENRFLKAAVKVILPEDVAQAARILRGKWYSMDLEIREKGRPFLEHRLNK